MADSPTSQEISRGGQQLVHDRLKGLGLSVTNAPARGLGYQLIARRGAGGSALTVLVRTNWKPKPAGGNGPPALAWDIPTNAVADLVAFADLSTDRVWLVLRDEIQTTGQQYKASAHKLVMVCQSGWTSAPHERIRDDQFTQLLAENRVESLFVQ